jgi:predicted HNH restriction endonuclease
MSWEKLVIEAEKCVMLCSHCHRKVHFRNLTILNPIVFDESKIQSEKNNRWGFKL